MLGKLPVPGRPTTLDFSRSRAYCACSRCRWGLFGHFFSRWLVGCFGFSGPLRQYFSLYRAVSQREGERIEESKNVQTTPTCIYCKCNRPLPYYDPNCRTPRHWKFTQNHRTTRPHAFSLVYHISLLSPSPWETARYRLKYYPKGPLSPKQPTDQPTVPV